MKKEVKEKKAINERIEEAKKLGTDNPAKALEILKPLVNNKYAYRIQEIKAFIDLNNSISFKQALEKGEFAQVTTLFNDANIQAWARFQHLRKNQIRYWQFLLAYQVHHKQQKMRNVATLLQNQLFTTQSLQSY